MTRTLFASNYSDNGTTHLLGFTHRRAQWGGIVVGYQPAEYQPHALDDLEGNNFQILANAILYAADARFRNDLTLTMSRGALPGDVLLQWNAGQANYTIYRSTDPLGTTDRCSRLGSTSGQSWADTPPTASILYYQIAGP